MARGRPFKCPYCGSTSTTRKGVRHTKTQGIRKLRYCTNCKRKFTPKNQKPAEVQNIEKESEDQKPDEEHHIGEQPQEHQDEQAQEPPQQPSTEQSME